MPLRPRAFAWLAVVLSACGPKPAAPGANAEPAPEPVAVRIAKIEGGKAPRVVHATGTFHADEEVTVAAEVAGRITDVMAEASDRVAPGAVLAKVDSTDYVLERNRAALAVTELLAKVGLEELPEGEPDFAKLPMVERARLDAENAKAKRERARTLHDRRPPLISPQDFADLVTSADMAESAHRAAVMTAQTDIAQARTRRAQLVAAEERVRDTVHHAPPGSATRTWLVAERHVAVGDYVSTGRAMFRLVDADPLELRVRVPERKMEGVVPGRPVRVTTASSREPVAGKVTRLLPEVDPRTRTFEVEIEIPNPEFRHAVGAFATAEIDVGEDANVALVPESAIVSFAGVRKLFVPAGGKTAERLVVLGRRVGKLVEIADGAKPGDAYIADPPPGLVAGTPIREGDGSTK